MSSVKKENKKNIIRSMSAITYYLLPKPLSFEIFFSLRTIQKIEKEVMSLPRVEALDETFPSV
jgi:hypothetical protein